MPQLNTPQTIKAYLSSNSTLIELNLSKQSLCDWNKNDLYEFGTILQDAPHVQKLDLSWNELGNWSTSQVEILSNVLSNTQISHIFLNRNNLQKWSGESLNVFNSALQSTTIKHISLAGNELQLWTKEHAGSIPAIILNTSITEIDLSWNHLDKWTKDHFDAFSYALTENPVPHIFWGGNDFYALSIRNILAFKSILNQVTGFHLDWNKLNQLTCTQIGEIGNLLKGSRTLTHLSLASNKLGCNSALQQQAWGAALQDSNIGILDLSQNDLYQWGFGNFKAMALATKNIQIKKLILKDNKLNRLGADPLMQIAKLLSKNFGAMQVNLSENKFSQEQINQFEKALTSET